MSKLEMIYAGTCECGAGTVQLFRTGKCAHCYIADLEKAAVPAELWADILEFIEDHVDVVDGADGPRPNRAMYLQQQIAAAVGGPDRKIDG